MTLKAIAMANALRCLAVPYRAVSHRILGAPLAGILRNCC